jgi:hypothetical protein
MTAIVALLLITGCLCIAFAPFADLFESGQGMHKERESNLRLVHAELEAMDRAARRMIAECPQWNGVERRAGS